MANGKPGRSKSKRSYEITFNYPYTYNSKLEPPITPTMQLLRFMFEKKLIGGRVGKPVRFIDDYWTGVEVTEKNRLILLDALTSEEFISKEEVAIEGRSKSVMVPIPAEFGREELTLLFHSDTIADIEAKVGYARAFYGLIPLLHSSKTRQLCMSRYYHVLFDMWLDRLFCKEIMTEDELKSEASKLAIIAIERIKEDEKVEGSACKVPDSGQLVKACEEMLCLGHNYKVWVRDSLNDKWCLRLSDADYDTIIKYYCKIHEIMYLLSTPTLKLLNELDYDGDPITLNFMTPDYKRLINDTDFYNASVKRINTWLAETLGSTRSNKAAFQIYQRLNSEKLPICGVVDNSYLDNDSSSRVRFILSKLLKLVLAVYHTDFIEEAMTVGQRYIGVCQYCGALFYREDSGQNFCKNYSRPKTPCNNMRKSDKKPTGNRSRCRRFDSRLSDLLPPKGDSK